MSRIVVLIIMFQLTILSVLFCVLYNKIQMGNREKIELIRKTSKLEYLRMNRDNISHMYDTIVSKEHSMIYFLRKIKMSDSNVIMSQCIQVDNVPIGTLSTCRVKL